MFCCLVTLQLWAITPIINYAVFSTPDQQTYIETYLLIPGSSVAFAPSEAGKLKASVEVTLLFMQGEKVVQFDKYMLSSPEVSAAEAQTFNLVDLKRYTLPAGAYNFELKFKDVNIEGEVAEKVENIELKIEAPSEKIDLSDILLLEKFEPTTTDNEYSKNGYDLMPNVLNFYPEDLNRVGFYAEIYNTDKVLEDPNFLVTFSVNYKNTKKIAKKLRSFKKQKAAPVNVVLSEFDISELPSGNYDLLIEVRNKKNELLVAKKTQFFRKNPIETYSLSDINKVDIEDTFVEELTDQEAGFYVGALYPIAQENEKQYIANLTKKKKNPDVDYQKRFLYNFWTQKDPTNPTDAFLSYKAEVDEVELLYKSQIRKGYSSDRGRVRLQYGKPDNIKEVDNEPGMVPYEVWHYYKLNNYQTDVIFVFYNPNLADNEYELIYSDVRGEVNDPRWKLKLANTFRTRNNSLDIDNNSTRDYFGKSLNDGF